MMMKSSPHSDLPRRFPFRAFSYEDLLSSVKVAEPRGIWILL